MIAMKQLLSQLHDRGQPAAEQLFGCPASEVVGRNVSILMPSPHHEDHDKYLEHYLTPGDARTIGIGREVMGRRRDGTRFRSICRSAK